MNIAQDTVARINYTLTDAEGNQVDSSNGEPLAYLHGHHNLIPGLEAALAGKTVGDQFTVTVPAAEAYGEVEEHLIQSGVPKAMFQGIDNLEVGMRFEAQSDQGFHSVVITSVEEETVTVDGNHELAGMDLTFNVEVIEVRAASAEELDHGHAHGAGGHQHDHD